MKLKDEMSKVLQDMNRHTKTLKGTFESLPEILNDVADYMELAKSEMDEFSTTDFSEIKASLAEMKSGLKEYSELSKYTYEHQKKGNEEILEAFIETKEIIEKLTESVVEKKEAIEKTSASVDNLKQSNRNTSRGIEQMIRANQGLLRSLGGIPKAIGQGTQAAAQLNRSVSANIPPAMKLVSALGPIALIATSIMAVVNTIQMLRRSVEETLPPIDELIGRSDSLNRESKSLSENLKENIEQLKILSEFGASDTLIKRFERENELLEKRIQTYATLAGMRQAEAVRSARDAAEELLQGRRGRLLGREREGDRWWGRENVPGLEQLLNIEQTRQEFRTLIDEMAQEGNLGGANIMRLDLYDFEKQLSEMKSTLADNIEDILTYYEVLRGSGVYAYEAKADALADLIVFFDDLNASYRETIKESRNLDSELERITERKLLRLKMHERAIERTERAESHRASVVEGVHNRILRAYRDTYSAAESVRTAHYALGHAIAGTSSEYMSQLDAFNKIMNLSPEYLRFLHDEHGNLRDVEDVVYDVTQAHIELLAVRQANAILDAAEQWQTETGSLRGYLSAVDNATQGLWRLVEARREALKWEEVNRLTSQGMAFEDARSTAQYFLRGIDQQLDLIRNLTTTAQTGARERGVFRPDGALLVSDPANREIRGEIIRLKDDISKQRFASGVYQQRGSAILRNSVNNTTNHQYVQSTQRTNISNGYRAETLNTYRYDTHNTTVNNRYRYNSTNANAAHPKYSYSLNIPEINVHASPNMDINALAARVKTEVIDGVAQYLRDACRNDLARGYA